jgi:hypothetical protein
VRKEINVDPAALGRVFAIPSNLQSLSQPEWPQTTRFRARTKHPREGARIHVEAEGIFQEFRRLAGLPTSLTPPDNTVRTPCAVRTRRKPAASSPSVRPS